MRIFVAFDAHGGGRKVHRTRLSGFLDAYMALVAVDPFEHVRAVFECAVLLLLLEAEHLRAGSDRAGE